MRILPVFAAIAALAFPCTAQAADCKLELGDSIQMIRSPSGQSLVPVTINGDPADFLLDTGGFYTQVSKHVAEKEKLPTRQGNFELFDMTGNISRDQAMIHDFRLGRRKGPDISLPVTEPGDLDGILALDQLTKLDMDVDFGTDKLNFFFPDHCPGQVVYWTSPANVAAIPIKMEGFHIVVTVSLDGNEEHAILDTGAGRTALTIPEEERLFKLQLGSDDAPEAGFLNGDQTLKMYRHTFKTLQIGAVTVNNPLVSIIPKAMGRNADKAQLVGDRTKSEKDLINIPDMIIGMDVLRKLHIYMAFGEQKLYVSSTAPSPQNATSH
jgi:predicted aspartyl protease